MHILKAKSQGKNILLTDFYVIFLKHSLKVTINKNRLVIVYLAFLNVPCPPDVNQRT